MFLYFILTAQNCFTKSNKNISTHKHFYKLLGCKESNPDEETDTNATYFLF